MERKSGEMLKAGLSRGALVLSFAAAVIGYAAAFASHLSAADASPGDYPSATIHAREHLHAGGTIEQQPEPGPQAEERSGLFADELDETGEDESAEIDGINDPLQPFNRAMFHFNDKLYYWALKPVARGYRFIVPQRARVCVRKFFSNAGTPVRLVNCLLQGRLKGAGTEIGRFVVNTTAGMRKDERL